MATLHRGRRGAAVLGMLALALGIACAPAGAADVFDALLGKWNFRMTWGDLVDDTGTVEAQRVGERIEMTCEGCDAPTLFRGTISGPNAIAWEYWVEAGVQSDCPNDKGWQPIRLTLSPDRSQISFWYVLHVSGNCGQLLRRAPVKYTLTRE
jgi:hypothetical protein